MSSNATAAGGTAGGAAGGGAGGAGGGGGPGGPVGPSPDEVLVFYWLDIGLLCVLGVFFLAFLPRAIGRFSNIAEWGRGLILRSSSQTNPMIQHVGSSERLYSVNTMSSYSSDQSHTVVDHNGFAKSGRGWATTPAGRGETVPPTHVRSLATVFHPVSKIFTYPLGPQKTFGKFLMTLGYIGTIIAVGLMNGNNPMLGPNRFGFIAVAQLPVVIALGTKNNVVGMLLGIGYEKINFLHQLVGSVTFIAAQLHATTYMFTFIIKDQPAALGSPLVQHGFWALYGVGILFIGTSEPIRKNAYTLFLIMHISGSVLFFVGLWFHQPSTAKYILLATGIYGLDHLFRIIKTRFTTARLTAVPELGLTRVELPRVGAGWRAGQHVRLRVLSGNMGLFGWATAHPFTIASASDSDGKGMVLMCKKAGGWTKKLYAAASQTGTGAYDDESGYKAQPMREMKVIVEGPYGGVGNMVMSSYSSVLLVVGGSGLTFALGAAEELIQGIHTGRSAVKFIEIVWSTQERGSLAPMLPVFSNLLGAVVNIPGVILRISVHYTRAEKPSTDGGKSSSSLESHLATLAPNLTLQPGRPPLQRITNTIARLTASVPDARGMAVGVCGPAGLVVDTSKAVRSVDADLRNACRGVELHEEVFGY